MAQNSKKQACAWNYACAHCQDKKCRL